MKKIDHEKMALAYLRDGSGLGGLPAIALIERASNAIDPAMAAFGPRGIGSALPDIALAISRLVDAHRELSMALGKHQARLDAKARKSAPRKRRTA